ncbi:MAG: GIY-YIG nuclease family protein [bacterium]
MSFSVYILKSEKTGKTYTGQTVHLEKRLLEHNSGKSISTRRNRPWKLVYHEEYNTRSEAILRENYFKSVEGRYFLKNQGIL